MYLYKLFSLALILCFISLHDLQAGPQATLSATPSWVIKRSTDYSTEPNDRDINYGYYMSLYDEQINVREQTRYYHTIKNIINESGVQSHSEISITFSDSYQKLVFHKVNIIRKGKTINKLNTNNIKIVNEEPQLSGHMIYEYSNALMILEDVRKGDQIELAYSVKGFNPIFDNHFSTDIVFYSSTSITNHYTSIILPANRTLYYKCHNEAPEPIHEIKNGNNIYEFPVLNLKPYQYEGNPPEWYRGYPYIELSEHKDWNEVALWADNVMNQTHGNLTNKLLTLINTWKKEAGGQKLMAAEKALRFVQNEIRYLGLEIGEYTHKPHSPSTTFNNRYGDCKDKSLLLVKILEQLDIPAQLVLVNTAQKKHIAEHLPAPTRFNHVIVQLEADGNLLYVDPTYSDQAGSITNNYIPNYGQGLIVNSESKQLTNLSYNNNGSIEIWEDLTVHYDSPAVLKVETTYKNKDADDFRSTLSYSGLGELEKNYEDYYTNIYGEAETADPIEIQEDTFSNTITIKESYLLHDIWQSEDGVKKLNIYSKSIYDRIPEVQSSKTETPHYLPFPVNIKHSYRIKMPEDWPIDLDPVSINTESYYFDFDASSIDNVVTVDLAYNTYQNFIHADQLEKYKNDYELIEDNVGIQLMVNENYSKGMEAAKSQGVAGTTNWITIFIAIIVFIAAFFTGRKINQTDTPPVSEIPDERGIHGWIWILVFVVCLKPLIYIYNVFTEGYFSTETWLSLGALGNTLLQLYLIIELTAMVFLGTFSLWVTYWMFKKRNIFPRFFIVLAFSTLIYNVLILVLSFVFKDLLGESYNDLVITMSKASAQSLIHIAVWGSIVHYSPVIKRVFSKPFAEAEDVGYTNEETISNGETSEQ